MEITSFPARCDREPAMSLHGTHRNGDVEKSVGPDIRPTANPFTTTGAISIFLSFIPEPAATLPFAVDRFMSLISSFFVRFWRLADEGIFIYH